MPMAVPALASAWPGAAAGAASAALAAVVFAFLDVVDALLCFVYALLDSLLEDSPARCYCRWSYRAAMEEEGMSDTLYVRRSACRDALAALLGAATTRRRRGSPSPSPLPEEQEARRRRSARWSDCGCSSCRACDDDHGRLHFVVKSPPAPEGPCHAQNGRHRHEREGEDAIFIHGFMSSSSFWTETVFPEPAINTCRLIAVDLLGFGDSPKPASCLYRLRDHVEVIESSVVEPLNLSSFHLVAHSMGCVVAIALAAKNPGRVRSITLVAPPYFPPCEQMASQVALCRLAGKRLWPPLLFGSAVMSWYEHIGRMVCFVVCKNHRLWEWLIKLITRKSEVGFVARDVTRHTHHSAWHTMHNVLCGGAAAQEGSLGAVAAAGVPVRLVHGGGDRVVPVECSRHLKARLPHAELRLMDELDHRTVVQGREKGFAEELRAFWSASRKAAPASFLRLYEHEDLQVNGVKAMLDS